MIYNYNGYHISLLRSYPIPWQQIIAFHYFKHSRLVNVIVDSHISLHKNYATDTHNHYKNGP